MINGLWGKKIGMTQVFTEDQRVVPVTAIDIAHWFVTQVKTAEKDGYNALQCGLVRPRYQGQPFSPEWVAAPKRYFSILREVKLVDEKATFQVGQMLSSENVLNQGDVVDASGITIGRGFQGVIKRHGHSGGRGSHGDKLGRGPGSLEGLRRSGRVRKGRKLPGHMGATERTIKNLEIIKVLPEERLVLVQGSVPGKTDSLVFLRKSRA